MDRLPTTMYPRSFAYLRPANMDEAVDQLATHGAGAGILAGGMSLVPMMKYRQRSPSVLIDIGRLRELAGIEATERGLRIGATTRHHEMAAARLPSVPAALPELAARIGDAQVRNMGTVGGGLAAVEPTGDWGGVLLAMRGEVEVASASGSRRIPADDLFVDTYRTSLNADELLTAAWFPLPGGRYASAHAKFDNRAAAAALISVAVCLAFEDAGLVMSAGIGCVGVAPVPIRLAAAEAALAGRPLEADTIEAAVRAARNELGYRFTSSVAGAVVRDALHRAGERAGTGGSS